MKKENQYYLTVPSVYFFLVVDVTSGNPSCRVLVETPSVYLFKYTTITLPAKKSDKWGFSHKASCQRFWAQTLL